MSDDFDFNGYLGLPAPHYTPVPDDIFDVFLSLLTGAELKVLLYVCRRTFGFKRDSDDISLSQLLTGIRTTDGRQLDGGTGLSKSTLLAALRSLADKRLIIAERRESADRGHEPTSYRLRLAEDQVRFSDPPWSENRSRDGSEIDLALGPKIDPPLDRKSIPQETDLQETAQETEERDRFEISKASNKLAELNDFYPTLDDVISAASRQLSDIQHWKSNRSRARKLAGTHSLSDSDAADLAREVTAECAARKVGAAYFFKVLEQRFAEQAVVHPPTSLAGRYSAVVHR